MVDEQI